MDNLLEVGLLSDHHDAMDHLIESEHVGMVLINCDNDPRLICLSGAAKIYLIRPYIAEDLKFLKKVLKTRYINIYHTDGANDALVLKQIGVYPEREAYNIMDLPTTDFYIQLREELIENGKQSVELTATHVRTKLPLKQRRFEELVKFWLNATIDFTLTIDDLDCLENTTSEEEAQCVANRICSYIRPLGMKLTERRYEPIYQMSRDFASFPKNVDDNTMRDFYRRKIEDHSDFVAFKTGIL